MQKGKKRSVLMALCVLLTWLSFVVDGAHALFVDSTALTGNVITTGSVNILVSNSQNPSSTVYDETRPGFSWSLIPGVFVDKYFLIKNTSPSNIEMDIDAFIVTSDIDPALNNLVDISIVQVDATGVETGEAMESTLGELRDHHSVIFGSIPQGEYRRFKMSVRLNSSYTGQGDSATYDLILTGTQHE